MSDGKGFVKAVEVVRAVAFVEELRWLIDNEVDILDASDRAMKHARACEESWCYANRQEGSEDIPNESGDEERVPRPKHTCRHCGNNACTLYNPICAEALYEHHQALKNGMPLEEDDR